MPPILRLRPLLLRLTVVALVGAILLAAMASGLDARALLRAMFDEIRQAGPVPFFAAMAVFPAFGFPISFFTLTAGAAFGTGLSVMGAAAAVGLNVALAYWLARRGVRPLVAAWLQRRGYPVPEVRPEDAFEFTLLVRVTPGPPFFAQSYLLGLAEIPFRTYFPISWLVGTGYSVGFIVFGESLLTGRAGLALTGICLIAAGLVAARLVRRRYAKRNA